MVTVQLDVKVYGEVFNAISQDETRCSHQTLIEFFN